MSKNGCGPGSAQLGSKGLLNSLPSPLKGIGIDPTRLPEVGLTAPLPPAALAITAVSLSAWTPFFMAPLQAFTASLHWGAKSITAITFSSSSSRTFTTSMRNSPHLSTASTMTLISLPGTAPPCRSNYPYLASILSCCVMC